MSNKQCKKLLFAIRKWGRGKSNPPIKEDDKDCRDIIKALNHWGKVSN